MEYLNKNTRVDFKTPGMTGKGKIVGVATSELPVIGKGYIIEVENNENLDYSHIVAYEYQITEIEQKQDIHIIEGVIERKYIESEDGEQYKGYSFSKDESQENGLYIKVCSWDTTRKHEDFYNFVDKELKITIEIKNKQ